MHTSPRSASMTLGGTRPRFVVDVKGRRLAVILSMHEYGQLLGDLHDLTVVAERRTEIPIDLATLRRLLKRPAPTSLEFK